MPKPNNRGRTRRSGLFIVGIVVLVVLGVGVTLAAFNWSAVKGVFAGDTNKKNQHEGKVAVVITPGAIPAFTALDPATFINPKTGDFHVSWVTEKVAVESNWIRNPALLRGRVLRRDKGAGLAVSEADLYPKGTQASPSAAIDPGYRGVTLSTKTIEGLVGLKRFDRVDLVAVINVRRTGNPNDPDQVMSPEAMAVAQSAREWKTERRTLVQNAKIIVPYTKSRDGSSQNECFVAIRNEEAPALADAIAKGAKIVCMARSGLPGGDMGHMVDMTDEGIAVDGIQVISGEDSWWSYVPATKVEDTPSTDEPVKEPKK